MRSSLELTYFLAVACFFGHNEKASAAGVTGTVHDLRVLNV